jgi:hypothetical protein
MVKKADQNLSVQGDYGQKSAHYSAVLITDMQTMRAVLLVRTFEARGRACARLNFSLFVAVRGPMVKIADQNLSVQSDYGQKNCALNCGFDY